MGRRELTGTDPVFECNIPDDDGGASKDRRQLVRQYGRMPRLLPRMMSIRHWLKSSKVAIRLVEEIQSSKHRWQPIFSVQQLRGTASRCRCRVRVTGALADSLDVVA